MRIIVNLLRFDPNINIGGNLTFATNIVKELLAMEHECLLLVTTKNRNMFYFDSELVSYDEVSIKSDQLMTRIIEENIAIHSCLKKNGETDVFYSPCSLLPFMRKSIKCKQVFTIHDLNFKYFKFSIIKKMYKEIMYSNSIRNADGISFVSNYTKSEVFNYYDVDCKSGITYNASHLSLDSHDSRYECDFLNHIGIKQGYILCLAQHKHKNPEYSIDIYFESVNQVPSLSKHKLLIAGLSNKRKIELDKYIHKKNYDRSNVKLLGFIDNEHMSSLYKLASVFLFPSTFEGFGIPVIEAQALGCPVICSNVTSLPEVMGESKGVVDLRDQQQWINELHEIILSEDYRQLRVKEGFNNVKRFNWQKSAESLLSIFK